MSSHAWMYSSSDDVGQPVSSMNRCSSCSRPSVGTSAKSTSWIGDQCTGSITLAVTSWRQASTDCSHSRRSPVRSRWSRRSHAAPSRTPVIVTTLYAGPLPCAWFMYQSRRASSPSASIGIQPVRKSVSNWSSLSPTTSCVSWMNSITRPPRRRDPGERVTIVRCAATGSPTCRAGPARRTAVPVLERRGVDAARRLDVVEELVLVGPHRVLHVHDGVTVDATAGYRREVEVGHRRPRQRHQHLGEDVVTRRVERPHPLLEVTALDATGEALVGVAVARRGDGHDAVRPRAAMREVAVPEQTGVVVFGEGRHPV